MSKENVSDSDGESNVVHVNFPSHALQGYVILPPHELRTEPQMPWVSVDHHSEGADWVYAYGATRTSFVTAVELDIPEVSGL